MLNLYTETPCQVKPSTPSSLLSFLCPSRDGTSRRSKHLSSSNAVEGHGGVAKDEKAFVSRYLASQSSIYFRQTKSYPRSFLWRVVGAEKVLEIQCADLTRSANDQNEAHLTLRFEFQDSIAPNGVALSDPDNANMLIIFVITMKKELHTLSLPTDFFRTPKASSGDVRQWWRSVVPSSFVIDHPHRIFANTPFELFVSFDSGRLQRLTRTAEDKGSSWTQENYDDRSWSASLRGIVPWRGTRAIQFGSRVLDPSTAQALVAASDSTYVYTVCMSHTLRIWNLTTGRLVASKDLLNKVRQPQDQVQLNPAELSFVRLLKTPFMHHPILITFSALEGGQFKFWDIKGGLTDPLTIEDKFPDAKLSPPDPDPSGNTIWSLTGFDIRPGNTHKPTELWILWRNNNYHQLYSIHFDMPNVPEAWETNWTKTATNMSTRGSPPDMIRSDPQDSTEKWMEYLFRPGRYTVEVLETSLSIYLQAAAPKKPPSQKPKSLPERLCASIAANVVLRKYGDSDMDYERFSSDTDFQWRNFWRIAETISEARQAPLGLSIDLFEDMPWLTMADQCCGIRECSSTELLEHNESNSLEHLDALASSRWPHRKINADAAKSQQKVSALIKCAAEFRQQFSVELSKDIRVALEKELFQDAELPIPSRIADFYDQCSLSDGISSEAYNQVMTDLEHIGASGGINKGLFFAVLDTLPQKLRRPKSLLRSTIFGSNLLVAGLQDRISSVRQLIIDLLVLVVFLECEVNQEETQMLDLDAPELFSYLLDHLREYEKNLWLVSHVRPVPLEFLGGDPASYPVRSNEAVSVQNSRIVTILHDTVGKDIRPQPATDKPQSCLITETLEEVESWLAGGDEISQEDGLVYVQCDLIAQKNIELASDFLRFQPRTAWSTYVRARLHLARSEFDAAAVYFKRAALHLSSGRAVGNLHEMSAGLLSMIDIESFHSGLPRYLHHVLTLFEDAKFFSHAADFAHLVLQSMTQDKTTAAPFRSQVLSRLFTAELKCSRFFTAYTALTQFADQALQRSSIVTLVDALLGPRATAVGPIDGLRVLQKLCIGLHPQLFHYLDQHLFALSKKQTSLPDPSNRIWSSEAGTDYLKVLHVLRIGQKDYRGAVTILLDRLRLVKKSRSARDDPQASQLRHTLLALINALNCVAPDEAYLLTDPEEAPRVNGVAGDLGAVVKGQTTSQTFRKRIIITLDDLRREYQQLLDKCSRIERGDFDFEMDAEGSDDDEALQGTDGNSRGEAMEL